MAQYKQRCSKCKENFVLVNSWRERNPTCYECQKKELEGEITDPEMKKMFDIPNELYFKSSFLRSIKVNYIKYGSLSERQIESFKKAVTEIQEKLEKEKEKVSK